MPLTFFPSALLSKLKQKFSSDAGLDLCGNEETLIKQAGEVTPVTRTKTDVRIEELQSSPLQDPHQGVQSTKDHSIAGSTIDLFSTVSSPGNFCVDSVARVAPPLTLPIANRRTNDVSSEELFKAAEENQLTYFEKAKRNGRPIDVVNEKGQTLLHVAVRSGCKDVFDFLIQDIANINKKDDSGNTSLHFAAFRGDEHMLYALIQTGADVNATTNLQSTPLHWGAMKGHINCVKMLLEHGADPNCINSLGSTPIHSATYCGFEEIVKILLSYKCDPRIINIKGKSAVDIANKSNATSIQTLFRNLNL